MFKSNPLIPKLFILIIVLLSVNGFLLVKSIELSKKIEEEKINDNPITEENEIDDPIDINSQDGFDINIFKKVVNISKQENKVISPLSIKIAMAMASEGAVESTLEEIRKVVGLEEGSNIEYKKLLDSISNQDEITFEIANSTWARQGLTFKQEFQNTLEQYYMSEAKVLDFNNPSSKDVINSWVKNKTNNKIDSIINSISPKDIMFLINAIYFNADWKEQFEKELTTEEDFTLVNGSKIKVDTMNRSFDSINYQEDSELQAIELPYGENGRFVMRVYLPNEKTDITDFVSNITMEKYNSWKKNFSIKEGSLSLPKFKSEYSDSMKDALANLGIIDAFDSQKANFERMINLTDANVYISDVVHKTYIDVSEKGTEAAAVTMVGMRATSMPMEPEEKFEMIVDRPFFFTIDDTREDTIIFMGVIEKPEY